MSQLDLLPGYFHCHNCGSREATHVRKSRRFRLCDACYTAIVPDLPDGQASNEAKRQQIAAYWDWHYQMALRYPVPTAIRTVKPARSIPANSDSHNPTCACGQPRRPLPHTSATPPDLFGGPFFLLCPICEAKASIDAILRMASAIHPDWDDEDWLDLLARSHPEAFDLGVLPDYWYQRIRVPTP